MISDLLSYSLKDFVLFSAESAQAVVQTYNSDIHPFQYLIVILNMITLFFIKKYPKIISIYLCALWLAIGTIFHNIYFVEINWSARWINYAWIFQALLLLSTFFFFKPVRVTEFQRKIGLTLFALTCLIPLSVLMPFSKGSVLLFGWGPLETALGTVFVAFLLFNKKLACLFAVIPILISLYYLTINALLV